MTAIRIAVAALLATAAVLAGGATGAQHSVRANVHPAALTVARPLPCCDD